MFSLCVSGLCNSDPLCEQYAAGTWPCDTDVKPRSAAGKQSMQVQSSGTGVTLIPSNVSPGMATCYHQDIGSKQFVVIP